MCGGRQKGDFGGVRAVCNAAAGRSGGSSLCARSETQCGHRSTPRSGWAMVCAGEDSARCPNSSLYSRFASVGRMAVAPGLNQGSPRAR